MDTREYKDVNPMTEEDYADTTCSCYGCRLANNEVASSGLLKRTGKIIVCEPNVVQLQAHRLGPLLYFFIGFYNLHASLRARILWVSEAI